MMNSQTIQFLLGTELRQISDCSPTLTLLNYLRLQEKAIGTKEGCAEGDCGACTVVLGELIEGELVYRAVNACILLVVMLDGKQLITVEHLKNLNGGNLHPAQQNLVDCHGSQCGFCTPGFVMSSYALYENTRQNAEKSAQNNLKNNQTWSNLAENSVDLTAEMNKTFAGNLCRCTGYGPIIEAGQKTLADAYANAKPYSEEKSAIIQQLLAIQPVVTKTIQTATQTYIQPQTITDLTQAKANYPKAHLLAGATDLGLWITKQHRHLETLISVNHIADLKTIHITDEQITLGAAVTYSQSLPILAKHFPVLEAYIERHSSTQIRNSGTLVGNIANGSPIGDMPPALMALGTTLKLTRQAGHRVLPLEDYFIEYGKQAIQPDEFIESITLPACLPSNSLFQVYKISKRFEQDISSVSAAFYIELENNRVTQARLCYGGMAGTPKRAALAEASLLNQIWSTDAIEQAALLLAQDFKPLDDFRASKVYRMTVAQNLLRKFFIKSQASNLPIQITHTGEIKHA